MKKNFTLMTFFLAGIFLTTLAQADNMITMKIKRGVTNVFTSPLEISNKVCAHFKETKGTAAKAIGFVPSIMHGVAYTIIRMGSGLWDIATCNLDVPKGGQPILKPDYAWQKE